MKVRKFCVFTLICCLLLGNINVFAANGDFLVVPQEKIEILQENVASAETKSTPSLSGCILGIGMSSRGVSITFTTSATQTANEIGVKNFVLQEKTWYGWKDLPISNYYINNADTYSGEIIYTNAVAGKTYRAHCTHYAKFGSTEVTLYNETNNFVYN